ncbi:hypothetical protein EWM64_g2677 [Hericium alpestre]|uniref:Uncharacterized protein n=1 Tax=Hericium alpestre TaxID=135208 RepID=A0A4Z0A2R6_9AGAM|nr:hypothetical protein EWM64_g2677 [Hericium alpestre]
MIGIFPPAPCITHFEILGPRQWIGYSETFAFDSFADLIRSIDNMPGLERLILNSQLFPRSEVSRQDVARQAGARTKFLHMKYLSIGGTPFQCAALMRHISIPSSASFSLDCARRAEDEDLSLVLVALRPYANNFKAGGPFLSIWASPGGRESLIVWGCPNPKELKLRVECCTGDNEAGRLGSLDRPYMDLTVRGPDDDVLPAFLDVLGSEDIHAVSIGGPHSRGRGPEWSNEDWIRAFTNCVNVQHVRMSGLRDAESFVRALNVYSHITSVAHHRLFPTLTSVWFHDVDFVVAAGYVIQDATGWKLSDLNGCILKLIVARQTLETIYTTGSRLVEGHTWMLTQCVTVLREHGEGPPFIPGGPLEFANVPRHGYSLRLQMPASYSLQPFYVLML